VAVARGLVLGWVTLLLALASGCRGDGHDARPGRVLLISMDTVRADHVMGPGATDETRHLDEIAQQGVRFTNFYAASTFTIPSHMSIFTGLDPAEHGVYVESTRLAAGVPTLAEILSSAGYRTQAFHEGGYVEPRFGFERGFTGYVQMPRLEVVRQGLPAILEWMREHRGEPYFLFLHTYAAHFPYGGWERYRAESPQRGLPSSSDMNLLNRLHPPDASGRVDLSRVPEDTRRLCTLYNHLAEDHTQQVGCGGTELGADFLASPHGAEDLAAIVKSYDERIRLIDRALGEIRETLVQLGEWDDTLLVVTSDHGEAFLEHGLERHGYIPFDTVVKAPLVISYPRALGGSGVHVVTGLAWHLDLLPTIASLAGARTPDGLRGVDLTPAMRGEASLPADRAVYPAVLRASHKGERPLRRIVVQGPGPWKYIEGHPDFGDPLGFLFDLSVDPEERTNLRASDAARNATLAAAARDYADRLVLRPPVSQITGQPVDPAQNVPRERLNLPEEELQRLRTLGYVE